MNVQIGANILCFFPWSILVPNFASELAQKAGYESLVKFLPYAALIHLQPSQDFDELNRFLRRQDTELEEMLRIIRQHGYDGDFIVETCLKLKGFNLFYLQKTMKDLLVRIKEILAK
jgi:hypothetical protein